MSKKKLQKIIASKAGTMQDAEENTKFVNVLVGEEFAHIKSGRDQGTFGKGTSGYRKLKAWALGLIVLILVLLSQ